MMMNNLEQSIANIIVYYDALITRLEQYDLYIIAF
jgi:hypothetical protein